MSPRRLGLAALCATLGTALAGACSDVVYVASNGGTTSGSGGGTGGAGAAGGASQSSSSSSAGSGGAGGAGGTAPVQGSWQVTAVDDMPDGTEVAVDSAGDVIVAGAFSGTIDLGDGPMTAATWGSLFVAKLDPAGHLLWSRSFDDAGVGGLAVDGNDDILLAGGFIDATDFGGAPLISAGLGDIYVAKLDPQGNPLYSRSFGDAQPQSASGLAVDAAGDVFVTGAFLGSLDFGGGPLVQGDEEGVFVVELDSLGQHVWSRSFGGDSNVSGDLVAVSPDGSLVVTGSYAGTLDFGDGPLPGGDGGIGSPSIFVLGLDAAGNHVWSQGLNLMSAAPVFDGAGNLYVSGPFAETVDFGSGPMAAGYFVHLAVAKFDPGHHLLWADQFGDVGTTVYGASAFPGGGGALLLAGYASGKLNLGGGELLGGPTQGGFLARLDGAGDHLWSRGFSGSGDLMGTSAAEAPSGDVLFAGTFSGTVDLVNGPTTSQGTVSDFFLLDVVP